MATLSVTIPNAKFQKAVDTFCSKYGYQATINGVPNPETDAQFAKRMVARVIQETMKEKQRRDLEVIAQQTPLDDVSDIT